MYDIAGGQNQVGWKVIGFNQLKNGGKGRLCVQAGQGTIGIPEQVSICNLYDFDRFCFASHASCCLKRMVAVVFCRLSQPFATELFNCMLTETHSRATITITID